ncbi:regulator of chromosome condensation domain-containing protein [Heterostelium album PN500]|uniref:Regulator of chromosome condensation domain-containing protein n=1 Tax=Heterostelium pallidum (strain ATCC 26659 / Pp 5 / PN500) TaxID=670386 RepID=D3BDN0_HETP5|nr:regulator of chromosome condensation domain-containing protein [Heterostelium album PN500]EFA80011.1 regulator of chromosome condensation domain-containing protein [Heterostelium album PN500]|eukprot:XP_020432131.1 regulator of chromosome condensation domain-containing protein [Heterostelium album PN500]
MSNRSIYHSGGGGGGGQQQHQHHLPTPTMLSSSVLGVLSSTLMMVPDSGGNSGYHGSSNSMMNNNNNHLSSSTNSLSSSSFTPSSFSGGVGGMTVSNSSGGISSMMSSHSQPQVGAFTQNYELYSLNRLFCINNTGVGGSGNSNNSNASGGGNNNNQLLHRRNNSNTFISAKEKSLSDHFHGSGASYYSSGSGGSNTPGSQLNGSDGYNTSQGVTIQLTAQGGYEDHLFFAMYCSNDYLIVRFVGQSKVPQYKYIQWSREHAKRIVSMSFDPNAHWLLCLQHDTSIVRIPIYFMVCKKMNQLEENNQSNNTPQPVEEKSIFSSIALKFNKNAQLQQQQQQQDKKPSQNIVNIPPLSNKSLVGSYCLWWRTSNGEDFGIIATTSGIVFFINLSTKEIQKKLKYEYPIIKLELITGTYESFLIVTTKSMVHHQVIIEQMVSDRRYETIVAHSINGNVNGGSGGYGSGSGNSNSAGGKGQDLSPFQTTTLFTSDRAMTERSLEKQKNENGNIMASFIKSNSKLEIYDPLYLNKFPLFVYQLPQSTTHFYFTKNLTFVSELADQHYDNSRVNVSIISNLVSGTASNSKFVKNQSMIQTFQLALGESVLAITSSLEANNSSSNGDSIYMPSCYLWTNFSVYEFRPKKSPEEIFFELVSKNLEKIDGEALGKTFRMDLLSLYETAADLSFDQGRYGRALDLYYLSGVKTNKLVLKFLEIGRMDIIMTHLKAILHQPDAFNDQEKKRMTNTLFQCYLQKLLMSKEEFKSSDAEFSYFLTNNWDYDRDAALHLLLQHGLLDYYFSVAHSGKMIGKALAMLLESNILHLDAERISFLQSSYPLELKSHQNGMIFDCLSPDIQVKLILEDNQNIPRYVKRLYHLLPMLSEKSLIEIATAFDPITFEPFNLTPSMTNKNNNNNNNNSNNNRDNNNMINSYSHHDSLNFESTTMLPGRSSENIPVRNEEYFELYITAILTLIHLRKSHHHYQSDEGNDRFLLKENEGEGNDGEDKEDEEEELPVVTVDPDLLLNPMPPLVKNEKKAVSVACGWEHIAVISSDGELFTWGNNSQGQLGHGLNVGKYQSTPRRVETFKSSPIIMISCGGEHSVAVDQSFQIYSWGSSRYGQLGHGVLTPQNLPKKIEDFTGGQKVLAIATGYAHTMVLKKSGDLFTFGWNDSGQLGLGNFKNRAVPMRIETSEIVGIHGERITAIAAGHSHSIMCLDNGDIYSWGANSKGQLGHGNIEKSLRPKQIDELKGKPIIKISCGHFHTVAISELNSVYCWGQGEHMCLGNGSNKNELSPKMIEFFINKKIEKVVCGLYHTATVTAAENGSDRGNVYICGGGEHGKLGTGGDLKTPFFDKPHPAVIPSLNSMNIVGFSSGSEFSAIITNNGALYTWGYGNFGQIGNGKTEDMWLPTKISLNDQRFMLFNQNSKGFAKARYSQEGLEDVLKSYSNSYRSFAIINKAIQFENWDVAATIYDVLEDYKSTLECRLIGLKKRNLDKEKETHILIQLLHNYIIKGSIFGIDSPPMISTITSMSPIQMSPPLFSTTPNLNSFQEIFPPINGSGGISASTGSLHHHTDQIASDGKKPTSAEKSKELLLLLILNYWREKDLPIQVIEDYILENIDSFSLPLSNIMQMNSNLEYPLILEFSTSLYLIIVKYYLHFMKNLSEREKDYQRASEKVLLTNIKENLEKDISSRTKIQIHSLVPDNTDSYSLNGGGYNQGPTNTFEKDVAFTCNHYFSKRKYFGNILPYFQSEVQKIGITSATTLKFIMEEYNHKWISLSCPVCLYNFIRDLANDPNIKPWKI